MTALDLAMRALILLCLAWTASVVLRRRSAALRAFVWTTALGAALALPVLVPLTPAWRVEWTVPVPAAESSAPVAPRAIVTPVAAAAPPAMPDRPAAAALRSGADEAPVAAASIDWRRAALFLSLAVTALLALRLAAAHAGLARLARLATPFDDAGWRDALADARRELDIRRPVAVRSSEAVNIPAVAGLVRPVLLLPVDAHEWAPDVRRAVLLHELAHVARRDALGQLLGRMACAVYWCLPLVWHAARRAAALREQASDDAVLRAGIAPAAYAESLVRLARGASGADTPAAALAMARPSHLRARVLAILDPGARRSAPGMSAFAIVLVAAAALVTTVAAVEPAIVPAADARTAVSVRENAASPTFSGSRAAGRDAEPTPPAPQAAAPTESRLCSRGVESSSTQARSNNGVRTWKVELTGDDCRVDLRAEGRIDFTADFTDISAISPGGFFRLDVSDAGLRRQLDIEPRDGSLARTWRVAGREQPYDAAARAWLAAFLIELDRRTAIGVDVRLPHLMAQGGVSAVLDETARMAGDHPRGRYYAALARATPLSAADATRVLQQAASLTRSDYYALELLRALAGRGLDGTARRAAIQLIEGMDSDYYRAESLEALVGAGRPGAADVDLLVRMVPRMSSDHYKRQTLTHVARAGGLTPDHLASLARIASSIESDYYLAEFLETLAAAGGASAAVRQAIVEAAGRIDSDHYIAEALRTLLRHSAGDNDAAAVLAVVPSIQSDHYREDVLEALLAAPKLGEGDLLGIVAAAAPMSDHYESATLRRVLGHRAATERVRTAVFDAASRLSRHYAEAVRRGR